MKTPVRKPYNVKGTFFVSHARRPGLDVPSLISVFGDQHSFQCGYFIVVLCVTFLLSISVLCLFYVR